ncbi:MAG: class A beta-lactamase [Sulfitobacter sp.]
MRAHLCPVHLLVLTLALVAWFWSTPGKAETAAVADLSRTVAELEHRIDARIGVVVHDSATGWYWGHRQDERFLMASTFKQVLCGAVLDRVAQTGGTLEVTLPVTAADILSFAPLTKEQVGKAVSLSTLCHATLDKSDNTAANLLLNWLGGPPAVTAFLRAMGDETTRLDRVEPDLNTFAPGDPRDTTTPAAMVAVWRAMLLGPALITAHRTRLKHWMENGSVMQNLIRASTPSGWGIADKSGGGRHHTRNLVAMITPPGKAPYFAAIYVSDTPATWATRNAAVARIGAAIMDVIKQRVSAQP